MATTRLLEIETKFLLRPSLLPRLASNTGSPPFHTLISLGTTNFIDTYYDSHNHALSSHGLWLRRRTYLFPKKTTSSRLELKVRVSGNFQSSVFDEIVDRSRIQDPVRRHLPQYNHDDDGKGDKGDMGIGILARFETERRQWMTDRRFGIVCDRTGFGQGVGEVEVMAPEEEGGKVRGEIEAFMERYGWFFGNGGGRVEGKLEKYIKLKEAGLLPMGTES